MSSSAAGRTADGSFTCLQEIGFHVFPGSTFGWIGAVLGEPFFENLTMPFGYRYRGLIRRDAIPQRLDIVDLIFHRHFVESGRRQRCDSTHRSRLPWVLVPIHRAPANSG